MTAAARLAVAVLTLCCLTGCAGPLVQGALPTPTSPPPAPLTPPPTLTPMPAASPIAMATVAASPTATGPAPATPMATKGARSPVPQHPTPRPITGASPAATALPGALLPSHRIIAYYGNPLAPVMGVLGEPPPDQMLARLQQQADAYAAADPKIPVQPALELIAVVAQQSAGADGLYRTRMSPTLLDQVAQWAASRHFLLILDVQIGHSTVASEVQALAPYLQRPYVELALDPEFAMTGQDTPGTVFGSMDATAINGAIATLAEMVTADHLPPKVLIVHRFVAEMLTNAGRIHLDPRVQVVIDMDGFGSPANKESKYREFVHDQGGQYAAIKLFYQQDAPLMAPHAVLGLDPAPNVVIYQ